MIKSVIFGTSLALVLAGVASCGGKKQAAAETAPAEATAELSFSTVPFGEETDTAVFAVDSAGYIVIFNGTDTTGWRGYGRENVPTSWHVEDSCLHFVPGSGEDADIIFAHNFTNFDVQFDWKVSEGANSGFFYMGQENKNDEGNLEWLFVSTPEYQILDNANHPDAKLGVDGNRQSASLYDLIPANPQNSKPFGEWNTARVVVNNGKVAHYQNGEKVLEYEMWTPEWVEMLQNSKFNEKELPAAFRLLNDKHPGFFAFQNHGDEVCFKNIRVKNL